MAGTARTPGSWARSGRPEITLNGQLGVRFKNVPTGPNETSAVTVEIGSDHLGRTALYGIALNRPITARRLKALPLEALRISAEKVLERETWHGQDRSALYYDDEGNVEEITWTASAPPSEASIELSATPVNERQSDSFLTAVAKVCRDARKKGLSGWRAVAESAGVQQAQAQRYIANADARAKQAKTKREASKFDTGTLKRVTDRPQRGGDE